jgi:hypothetical protein
MNETLRQRLGHNFTPPKKIAQKVPAPYETDAVPLADKVIHLHYFTGGSDWYLAELDPTGTLAFGFVCLNSDRQNAEWGWLDLAELESVYVPPFGIVERDCWWRPRRFAEAVPWAQ